MPARREDGAPVVVPRRRRTPRKQPASQGHPSRGGTTVGGGTTTKPRVYRSPTPSVPEQRRRQAAADRGRAVRTMSPVGSQLTMSERTRARKRQLRQRQGRILSRLLGSSTKPITTPERDGPELPGIYKETWKPLARRALERHEGRRPSVEEAERKALTNTRTKDHRSLLDKAVDFLDPLSRQSRGSITKEDFGSVAKSITKGVVQDTPPGVQTSGAGVKPERVAIAAGTILANTAEHPVKTAKDLAKNAPGMVAAAAGAVADPLETWRVAKEDVKGRYGPYLSGKQSHAKFEKQVDKDPLPYALDVLASGVPVSRAITATGRTMGKGRLRRVYSGVDNPRPPLRVGSSTRPQRLSKGVVGAPVQRAVDKARGKRDTRQAKGKRLGLRQEALQAQDAGAVRPLSSRLNLAGLSGADRNLAAQLEASARNVYQSRMKKEVRLPYVKLRKAVRTKGRRDPVKEAALDLMVQHGARTAAELRDWARRRIAFHEGKRDGSPSEWDGHHSADAIPLLREVEAKADQLATKTLQEAADLAQRQGVRIRDLDPTLDEGVSIREAEPSARVLGLERSDTPENAMYHGTTPETAAEIRASGSFNGRRRDEIWLAADRGLAKEYGDTQMVAGYNARRPLDVDSPEFADLIVENGGRVPTNDALRALGYDAVIRTGPQGWAKVLDPNIVRLNESPGHYEGRVREAVGELSSAPPGYMRHTRRDAGASEFALGHGQFVPEPQSTRYTAFDLGRYDVSVEAGFAAPWARSIKTGVAKDLAEGMADSFALDHIIDVATGEPIVLTRRGADGHIAAGATKAEVLRAWERGALDPSEYSLLNVASLMKALDDNPGTLEADALLLEGVDGALMKALDVKDGPDGGWMIVRRAAVDHMRASVRFQSALGRIARRYLKGLPSRWILGTNPSWLITQVANNASLAVLAGIGPRDYLAFRTALVDLKRTDPEAYEMLQARIGAEIGGAAESVGYERMGASVAGLSGDGTLGKLHTLYEGWRNSAALPGGRVLNLSALFRGDAVNNAFFRNVVAINEAKVTKLRGLEDAFGEAVTTTDRFMASFRSLDANELADLVRNPQALESMGQAVDSVLGNYTRFTPAERAVLQGNIMFYGFLRFSLRFALHTLPVQHPFATAIVGKLADLHEQEVRDLLGLDEDDPLPFGALAAVYNVTDDGKLEAWPLARLNPMGNVLMDSLVQGSGDRLAYTAPLRMLSPFAVELFEQAFQSDVFTGKHWRVGEITARVGEQGGPAVLGSDRARHALGSFGQMFMPWRVWEQAQADGRTRSDTSLPFDGQYLTFKDEDARKSQLGREREAPKRGYLAELGRQSVGPLGYPVTGRDNEASLPGFAEFQAEQDHAARDLRAGLPRNPLRHSNKAAAKTYDELQRVEARKAALRKRKHPGNGERIEASNPTPEYERLLERARQLNTKLHRQTKGKHGETYASDGSENVTAEDILGSSDTVTPGDLIGDSGSITADEILAGAR